MDRQRALSRMRPLVEFLCGPACAGRAPGTEGARLARERLIEELAGAGLSPAGSDGWLQPVPRSGAVNLLGRLAGSGPQAERAILVAAHYDHLGPREGGGWYPGADDNAAAVAILVEAARELAARPPAGRQVLFCAFDAEEPPWFLGEGMGSAHWVAQPTLPLERIDAMVCMDLVGHGVGPDEFPADVRQSLFVLGAELSPGTGDLVERVAGQLKGVKPRRLGHDVIMPLSDYYAFQQAGVPFLFLTCGRWLHYHSPTDTPDRLDWPKIAATAEFLVALTDALRRRPEPRVEFQADARDDLATLRTLLDVAGRLAPLVPQAAGAVQLLESLVRQAAHRGGQLSPEEQAMLPTLVASLEATLEG